MAKTLVSRNRTVIALFSPVALAVIVVCVLLLAAPRAEATVFSCYHEPLETNVTFTVQVRVNLADGLSGDEAVNVANSVADFDGMTRHSVNSTVHNADGSWTVNLSWGGLGEELSHVFQAKIYPSNQTVLFSHCR